MSTASTPNSEAPNPHDQAPSSPQSPASQAQAPSWVLETLHAAESDTRRQPWKATFGESVDCRIDDGEDLVRIEKSVGGKFDPDCPFRTQGSSLAA